MLDDEITLPFIFVAEGADPPSELAEFKSAHPGWVSFPATFIPHEQPVQEGEVLRTQFASEQGWEPPPRKEPIPPQPTQTDFRAAVRAFQRASAEHSDPVTALRALRDRPEDFDDPASSSRLNVYAEGGAIDLGNQPTPPSSNDSSLPLAQSDKIKAAIPIPLNLSSTAISNIVRATRLPEGQSDVAVLPTRPSPATVPFVQPGTAIGTVQLVAAGLRCEGVSGGCQNGGSFGTTAVFGVSGRNLCVDCAVKSLGIENEPAGEKIIILRPFLVQGR